MKLFKKYISLTLAGLTNRLASQAGSPRFRKTLVTNGYCINVHQEDFGHEHALVLRTHQLRDLRNLRYILND